MRGNTGAFDIDWFHVAIQGAMLFINDAITLHDRRRMYASHDGRFACEQPSQADADLTAGFD